MCQLSSGKLILATSATSVVSLDKVMSGCQCQMSMSKTFIGGAVCREFESEAPVAEEMLDWVICSSEQFCFQMCVECGDGSGTFSR